MRAIRMKHGVVFLKIDGVSIKIKANGEVGLSPILFDNVEWDLRTEPPSEWEYITESDVRGLGEGVYEAVLAEADSYNKLLGRKPADEKR